MGNYKRPIRDGMRIDWDVPIVMDDGIALRCDVFHPVEDGRYPVLMAMGPYGKWMHFSDLFKDQWNPLHTEHPEVLADTTNRYQVYEQLNPERFVPDGYAVVRIDLRGAGRSPDFSMCGPPAKRRTITTASNGPQNNLGPAARSA